MTRGYRVALLTLIGLELAFMAWLVLSPSPAVPDSSVAALSRWLIDRGIGDWEFVPGRVEFGLNVVMFIPLGLTLVLLFLRMPWWVCPGIGFVTAAGIELVQRDLLSARQSDWSDVWANTAGMTLGAGAGVLVRMVVKWRARARRGRSAIL
jgi:hypothetical protein